MRRHVIRLGDPTTHGGKVVSASATRFIFGKPVARMGDKATCPIPGHGVVTIVEGDPDWTDDGKPIALEGHKCSCGCSLISTLPNVVRSPEGTGDAGKGIAGAVAAAVVVTARQDDDDLEYYFVAEREDGSAADLAYRIDTGTKKLHEGLLGTDGHTIALPISQAGDAIFWIPQT